MKLKKIILTVLLTLGLAASVAAQTLSESSFKYEGSFLIPSSGGGGYYMEYGLAPLSMSQNGLYVGCGRPLGPAIAEFSIPSIGGTAKLLMNCTQIPNIYAVAGDPRPGGVLSYNGRIIVSAFSEYDAAGTVKLSHALYPNRFVQVGQGGAWTGGYMGLIPSDLQSSLGGPAFTGQGGLSIISRTSSGPSFSVFNPDAVGTSGTTPGQLLLGFPLENQLAPLTANAVWQRGDVLMGGFIPPGSRSVVFIYTHGTGPYCYGEAKQCGDPVMPYKGDHAYPYYYQMMAFSLDDLLRVKKGEIPYYAPRPYATWRLSALGTSGNASASPGSATFDPSTGKVYIAPSNGAGPNRIHVYTFNGSTNVPPVPPVNKTFTFTIPGTPATTKTVTVEIPAVPARTVTCTLKGEVLSCQ